MNQISLNITFDTSYDVSEKYVSQHSKQYTHHETYHHNLLGTPTTARVQYSIFFHELV